MHLNQQMCMVQNKSEHLLSATVQFFSYTLFLLATFWRGGGEGGGRDGKHWRWGGGGERKHWQWGGRLKEKK